MLMKVAMLMEAAWSIEATLMVKDVWMITRLSLSWQPHQVRLLLNLAPIYGPVEINPQLWFTPLPQQSPLKKEQILLSPFCRDHEGSTSLIEVARLSSEDIQHPHDHVSQWVVSLFHLDKARLQPQVHCFNPTVLQGSWLEKRAEVNLVAGFTNLLCPLRCQRWKEANHL